MSDALIKKGALVGIKLTTETIGWMSIFQKIARVDVKDCFIDKRDLLIFVVDKSHLSKAIGRNAMNIRALEKMLKRKIKILEYDPDVVSFVKNIVHPLKITDAAVVDNVITLMPQDSRTRGYLIGRAASSLRNTEMIVKRYFPDTKEIRVV